jgi:hypothetical protein
VSIADIKKNVVSSTIYKKGENETQSQIYEKFCSSELRTLYGVMQQFEILLKNVNFLEV